MKPLYENPDMKLADGFERKVEDYEEHYLRATKADDDPEELVGPGEDFEKMREWQYELMIEQGLQPEHAVLDYGCGVLRAGIPLIEYLETGNYMGTDISLRTILHGYEELHQRDLGHKNPFIINNEGVSFERIPENSVDYMLVQSVWTHLPPKRLKTFVENMGSVLKKDGAVIVTAYIEDEIEYVHYDENGVDWKYPRENLEALIQSQGFKSYVIDKEHPNNLKVLRIERND